MKCLCFCHPDDDAATWGRQLETLQRLFTAARRNRLEFLLEVIPSKVGPVDERTVPAIVLRVHEAGVFPDWWKLEPLSTDALWAGACEAIREGDPQVRGVVVLGLDAPAAELRRRFEVAARHPLVKGFAVGRTIFGDAARGWFRGDTSDAQAVDDMARRFAALAETWDAARAEARAREAAE